GGRSILCTDSGEQRPAMRPCGEQKEFGALPLFLSPEESSQTSGKRSTERSVIDEAAGYSDARWITLRSSRQAPRGLRKERPNNTGKSCGLFPSGSTLPCFLPAPCAPDTSCWP